MVRGQKERDELFRKHRYGLIWLGRLKDYYEIQESSNLPQCIDPNWCLLSTLNPAKLEFLKRKNG